MERLKKFGRAVFLAAQKVLVPVMLVFVYVFALGAMALVARVVKLFARRPRGDSFWRETGGGANSVDEAEAQS